MAYEQKSLPRHWADSSGMFRSYRVAPNPLLSVNFPSAGFHPEVSMPFEPILSLVPALLAFDVPTVNTPTFTAALFL